MAGGLVLLRSFIMDLQPRRRRRRRDVIGAIWNQVAASQCVIRRRVTGYELDGSRLLKNMQSWKESSGVNPSDRSSQID